MLRSFLSGLLLFALFALIGVPVFTVQAAIVPCNPLIKGQECTFDQLQALPGSLFSQVIGYAAVFAMLFIVVAGVRMTIFWFSGDSESNLSSAKTAFFQAVVGFVLILVAYLVINLLIKLLGGGGIEEVFQRLLG